MSQLHHTIFASTLLALAAPAAGQEVQSDYAEGIAFFERAEVGNLEITPFGIVRDTRCADARLCTRDDRLIVSVILHDRRIPREIVLEQGQRAAVPGGWMVLREAGTAPSRSGVQPLRNYRLGIEFIPLTPADFRQSR